MSMVRIGDDRAYIEFEFLLASAPLPYGFDVACSVGARCGDFSGWVALVWFSSYQVGAFLDELRTLPHSRGNSASLFNYSSWTNYDPLRFEISYPEEAEHLVVEADLSWPVEIGGRSHDLKVSVAFPLDHREVPAMREGFHKMVFGW